MSGSRTVDQIEQDIEQQEKLMYVHQKNGNYADAEKNRLKIEQLEKDHEVRSLYQMNFRHKNQHSDLQKSHKDQFAAFNDFWNKREAEILNQNQKMEGQMVARHKQELQHTKSQLEVQYSPKVKQSSELLNLRKMEEHMVKQKNFAEAHKVQQQIFEMEKIQKGSWLDKRNQRIETALTTLRGKQSVELTNLRKRYKTLLDETMTDRKIQQERLLQKHQNLHKDLKSQHQKEVLNFKGQFKSKGGRDSPMRTRSSFHS